MEGGSEIHYVLIVLASETYRYIDEHIDLLKPIQHIQHYVRVLHTRMYY